MDPIVAYLMEQIGAPIPALPTLLLAGGAHNA